MRILGIDTAIPTASVALVENGELLVEQIQARLAGGPRGNHAEVILPLIQSLFNKAKITLSDLSGMAVSIGPGSFTGLRIGLATAKGMAYESNLPLIGVSTLHAGAARVRNFDGLIGSMLDARKSEVYLALFRRSQKTLTRLTPDAAVSVKSAVELVRKYQTVGSSALLIGSGAKAYEREISESFGPSVRISAGACYSSVAAQVALLADGRFDAAALDDAGALAPVYLRISEAESKPKNLA
ncbi:MAG: tRNA (adenosine(37)-N6)-threonylcarbamoyltransferase complex dimerization subunit type 1 TsaB [Candidatus Binatia bacterium]